MKLLDERGIGTVWSICKEKFALAGHTHNYAGSGSAGGSANSAIGVVDYGQTDKTIQIGYSGAGITGDQIKYIAGYTSGGSNVNAKIKDVSKDALKAWLGLGSLAYSSSSIPTKISQLTNDKGFVTGSVSGNTVTINGKSTTWSNTWRGIQDNLTSSSTSDSLSANQGKVLKGLIDSKANSSDLSLYAQKHEAIKEIYSYSTDDGGATGRQVLEVVKANNKSDTIILESATPRNDGVMLAEDKSKLDGIATGANNYTLPIATTSTRGGIMSTTQEFSGNFGWPIYVIPDGRAFTYIPGLYVNGSNGSIKDIKVNNLDKQTSAIYNSEGIIRQTSNGYTTMSLPAKGGTLALTSDLENIQLKKGNTTYDDGVIQRTVDNFTNIISLPDNSGKLALDNAIKFNFAGNIKNCEDRKINFVFGDGDIKLDSLRNCEDGTIVFFAADNNCTVTDSQKDWIFNGNYVLSGNAKEIYGRTICIITVNQGGIIVYELS